MLAVSRTASVKGRITFLIVSTKTINGIKIGGVPLGIRCTNRFDVLNTQPWIIKPTHKDKDIIIDTDIWAVAVKMYGSSPGRLFIIIKINIATIIFIINGFFLINGLNSLKM